MTTDRVQLNEPDDWLGPAYAVGLVDEIVLTNATVHFEMLGDTSGYFDITTPARWVFARVYCRPTTRRERRDILRCDGDRLVDHFRQLLPPRWTPGRETWWSIPLWRRPWALLTCWWRDRQVARCVLCVRVDEDEPTPR